MADAESDPQPPTRSAPLDVIPLQVAPGAGSNNVIAFRSTTYKWGPKAPSTGTGFFAAEYRAHSCTLHVTVKCRFTFRTGEGIEFRTHPSTGERYTSTVLNKEWSESEKAEWKVAFMAQASQFWSFSHRFNCTSPGLETLFAIPQIRFQEATDADAQAMIVNANYTVNPDHRRACGDDFRSCVNGQSSDLLRDSVIEMSARHEAGHMLGLGDEYEGANRPEARHSALVEKEFGYKVLAGKVNTANGKLDQTSIMCDSRKGTTILPEHGVVLLEVLREATQKNWQIQPTTFLTPDP